MVACDPWWRASNKCRFQAPRTLSAQYPTGGPFAVSRSTRRPFRLRSRWLWALRGFFVLFRGSTANAGRLVDTYALSDGVYLGSYLLPHRAEAIAYLADGRLAVLENNFIPTVRLLELPEATGAAMISLRFRLTRALVVLCLVCQGCSDPAPLGDSASVTGYWASKPGCS